MSQVIYRPNLDGDYGTWTPSGGGFHYDEVNEVIADDDGTFVFKGPFPPNGIYLDSWHIQDPGIELPLAAYINFIEVFHRGRAVNGAARVWVAPFIQNNDWGAPGPYMGSSARYIGLGYANFTQRWYLNPSSGSNFMRNDVINLQIGVADMSGSATVRCTQAFLTVDFSIGLNVGGGVEDWG